MDKLGCSYSGGLLRQELVAELSACAECEVAGVVAKHPELLAAVGEEFTIPVSRRFATIAEGLDGSKAGAVWWRCRGGHKEAIPGRPPTGRLHV